MALEEVARKLAGTLTSTFRFLSAYGTRLLVLTFRPRLFAPVRPVEDDPDGQVV